MAHYEARMTSKGQLTVPAPVREFFALKAGDTVDFYLDERTRSVRMRARNRPISSIFGALGKYVDAKVRSVTPEETDQAIGDAIAEDDARITRQYTEWQEFQRWKKRHRRQDAAE
jgi:AbrB family looped-hinge helix DNA binding protein